MQIKSILGVVVFLFLLQQQVYGQFLPGNQPEQDACNALEICNDGFFSPYTYQGRGQVYDLSTTPCSTNGLGADEANSVWLKLVINTPGVLVFKIKPVASQDDYDWAVLDITNKSCSNLSPSDVIRCNFNNNQPVSNNGITGLDMNSNVTGVMAGTTGQPYCKYIDAYAGQMLLIMINNFGVLGQGLTSGFSIDFNGSTATFNNTGNPSLSAIQASCNKKQEVIVHLNKPVKCSSIAANGSDFLLSPQGSIASAQGINCSLNSGGYTDKVKITFASDLQPGNYTLQAAVGTDNNPLLDLCNNALVLPDVLTFNVPVLETQINDTICPKQLPYIWNGITVTQGGVNVASRTFPNQTGCDSIVRLSLLVVDTIQTTENISICPEQLPFTWNGITINNGGNHVANYRTVTASQCDSLVYLNLTVQYPVIDTFVLEGCDSVVFNNKTYYSSATDVLDTIISSIGCDSVFALLQVTVFPVDPVIFLKDIAGCGSVDYLGVHYESSTTLRDTLFTIHGCDSVYNVTNIIVYPDIPEKVTQLEADCDSVRFEGKTYYSNTNLVDTFQNVLGCDSMIRTVLIRPEHFKIDLTANHEKLVKDVLLILKVTANVPYYDVLSWTPSHLFSQQTLYEQQLLAQESAAIQVTAKSALGCEGNATLNIEVEELIPEVRMPNAFTPNGDELNDVFTPFFLNKTGHRIEEFVIYNRLGQRVYLAKGVEDAGWNGNYFNGDKPAEAGVYFYYLRVSFVDGKKVDLKGDVSLLR